MRDVIAGPTCKDLVQGARSVHVFFESRMCLDDTSIYARAMSTDHRASQEAHRLSNKN